MPRRAARTTATKAPDGLVPVMLTIPLDQPPTVADAALSEMDTAATPERAEQAEALHPPAPPPEHTPTPEEEAEQARWAARKTRAQAEVARHLARFEQHRLPLNYPGAVELARELLLYALSLEEKPCTVCGHATARLARAEAEARELETQAALLARAFTDALHEREQASLRRPQAPQPTQQRHPPRAQRRATPANVSPLRPRLSRRPPPGTTGPGILPPPANNPALTEAIARRA